MNQENSRLLPKRVRYWKRGQIATTALDRYEYQINNGKKKDALAILREWVI